jgi:hypothetical protein
MSVHRDVHPKPNMAIARRSSRHAADLDHLGGLAWSKTQQDHLTRGTRVALIEKQIAQAEVHGNAADDFEWMDHVRTMKHDRRGPCLHGSLGVSMLETAGFFTEFAAAVQEHQNRAARVHAPSLGDGRGQVIRRGQRDVTAGCMSRTRQVGGNDLDGPEVFRGGTPKTNRGNPERGDAGRLQCVHGALEGAHTGIERVVVGHGDRGHLGVDQGSQPSRWTAQSGVRHGGARQAPAHRGFQIDDASVRACQSSLQGGQNLRPECVPQRVRA